MKLTSLFYQSVVKHVKLVKIRWAGHFARIHPLDVAKNILDEQLQGTWGTPVGGWRWE